MTLQSRNTLILWTIVALLLVWRIAIALHAPVTGLDSVWYLSQTYSLTRGEWLTSTFGHNVLQPFLLPYMYGVLSAPFFAIFGNSPYSILLWNALLLIGIVALILRLCAHYRIQSLLIRLMLVMMFLASSYLYGPRPETITILLMLVLLNIAVTLTSEKTPTIRVVLVGVLAAVIGVVQPIGGVSAILLFFLIGLWRRLPLQYFILAGAATLIGVGLLYGPIVLIDPQQWYNDMFVRFYEGDTRGGLDILLFVKYSIYAPFIFVPFVLMLSKTRPLGKIILEVVALVFFILALLPFSRSYYYVYVTLYMMWRVLENGLPRLSPRLEGLVYGTLALIMPFFSHYYLTVQHLENPQYGAQARAIAEEVQRQSAEAEGLIWVDGAIGMNAIQNPNSRLYFRFYQAFMFVPIVLAPEDRMLLTSEGELESYNVGRNLPNGLEDVEIREIIPPNDRGLIAIEPFRIERSEPIGLWIITAKP